jgi:hypothetical protein
MIIVIIIIIIMIVIIIITHRQIMMTTITTMCAITHCAIQSYEQLEQAVEDEQLMQFLKLE